METDALHGEALVLGLNEIGFIGTPWKEDSNREVPLISLEDERVVATEDAID